MFMPQGMLIGFCEHISSTRPPTTSLSIFEPIKYRDVEKINDKIPVQIFIRRVAINWNNITNKKEKIIPSDSGETWSRMVDTEFQNTRLQAARDYPLGFWRSETQCLGNRIPQSFASPQSFRRCGQQPRTAEIGQCVCRSNRKGATHLVIFWCSRYFP